MPLLRGDLTNCPNIQLMAFAYDGAWAEYTVAQAGGLTRVPDNVPLEQAAILADAVSTPFGAVVRTGQVAVGEAVGVWGVGGVGTHIVQLARLVGAVPILAFDINPAVRERALELGADHVFDSRDPDLVRKVAEATGGKMLDVAFDSAGLKVTFDQALQCVMTGGRVVVVGLSGQEAPTLRLRAWCRPTSRRSRHSSPAGAWTSPAPSARSSRSRTSPRASRSCATTSGIRSGSLYSPDVSGCRRTVTAWVTDSR